MFNLVKKLTLSLILFTNLFSINDNLQTGIQLFEAGELVKANDFFEKFVDKNPENPEGFYYLGRISYRKNDLKEAEKNFKKAVELEPNSSLYHTWLGDTYGNRINNVSIFKKIGMAKNVKKHYEMALRLDKSNTKALNGLIIFYTEAPGIVGGSKDKAKEFATRLKDLDEYMGYLAFARIYQKEKKYKLAEEEYLAAISDFPEKLNVRFQLGYFYQRQELYSKAFDLFEEMVADSSDYLGALYQIGRTGVLSGHNLDRAEQVFKEYLNYEPGQDNPSLASAHWRLGQLYELKNNKDLAKLEYEAALTLEPDHEAAKKALKMLK